MIVPHALITATVTAMLAGVISTANGQGTPPPSGGLKVAESAGKIETALLGAKAIDEAAKQIFSTVKSTLTPCELSSKKILLYGADHVLDFKAYTTFDAQLSLAEEFLKIAKSAPCAAPSPEIKSLEDLIKQFDDQSLYLRESLFAVPGLTKVLGSLKTLDKILDYFRTAHSFRGVDLKFEDSMLVHAVAGKFSECKYKIQLPSVYPLTPSEPLLATLKRLVSLVVRQQLAQLTSEDCRRTAATANSGQTQRRYRAYANALDAAVDMCDTFISNLTTEKNGKTPLTQVLLEAKIANTLEDGGYLLVVKIQEAGGSQYTQKNMTTFLWGVAPPVFYMGGVVVSFVLIDGSDGTVKASGSFPVHGGFTKVDGIEKKLNPKGPRRTSNSAMISPCAPSPQTKE